MLLDRDHCSRHRHLRGCIHQDDQLLAIDGNLDRMPLAVRVRDLPPTGHMATAFIRRRRLQIGGSDNPRDRGGQDFDLGQGLHDTIEQRLQLAPIPLGDILRQRVPADGLLRTRTLASGGAPLADPMPHQVGIAAHPTASGPQR
jgi:hypothetical protein